MTFTPNQHAYGIDPVTLTTLIAAGVSAAAAGAGVGIDVARGDKAIIDSLTASNPCFAANRKRLEYLRKQAGILFDADRDGKRKGKDVQDEIRLLEDRQRRLRKGTLTCPWEIGPLSHQYDTLKLAEAAYNTSQFGNTSGRGSAVPKSTMSSRYAAQASKVLSGEKNLAKQADEQQAAAKRKQQAAEREAAALEKKIKEAEQMLQASPSSDTSPSWLEQSTLIPSISNGIVVAGGAAFGVLLLGGIALALRR